MQGVSWDKIKEDESYLQRCCKYDLKNISIPQNCFKYVSLAMAWSLRWVVRSRVEGIVFQ